MAQQEFPDAIHSLAFSRTSKHFETSWMAVGDRGGSVHFIPVDEHGPHSGIVSPNSSVHRGRVWQAHTGRVYSLAFSQDGRRLFSAGEDGLLKVWELDALQISSPLMERVSDFDLGSDDKVFVGSEAASTHTPTRMRQESGYELCPVDGRFIRVAQETGAMYVLNQQEQIVKIARGGTDITEVVHPAAGQRAHLFCVADDESCLIAELLTKPRNEIQLVYGLPPRRSRIPCQSNLHALQLFDKDRHFVFDQEKDLVIAETATGRILRRLSGHKSTIWDVAVSPDGEHIASVSKDRTVRVWNWRTGTEVWSEVAHANEAATVAFTPDGSTLATTGADGFLRLWRWRIGALVFEYPLVDSPVRKMRFSADGRKLIALANDRIRIYDATSAGEP